MTDDRKIGILTPRARLQGAAHSLQAADRAQVSASPQPEPSETAQRTTPAKASKRRVTKTAQPASAATRVQLAADVTTDLRGRARAAFRHAAFHEAVPTFSQFVANALEAEIKRIETEYTAATRSSPSTKTSRAGAAQGVSGRYGPFSDARGAVLVTLP